MKALLNVLALAVTAVTLSSCAVGSGVAGGAVFALMSKQASQLTPDGEHALIERVRGNVEPARTNERK